MNGQLSKNIVNQDLFGTAKARNLKFDLIVIFKTQFLAKNSL